MSGSLEPSGFFVLRTPLLPFDDFIRWTTALDPVAELFEVLNRPEVAEAVRLASPSLAAALAVPASTRATRALPGLAAYFARMCSRIAPFGLFAGYSVGDLGVDTCLSVPDAAAYRRHTSLDMGYLSMLVAALERDPVVRRELTWSPNTSLYRAAGRLHVAAAKVVGAGKNYDLVAVDDCEAIDLLLDCARPGATLDVLITALVAKGVSRDAADSFVTAVVDAQLLVSEIELRVTGDEPIDGLIGSLAAHPSTAEVAGCLDEARTALRAIDTAPPGIPLGQYHAVQSLLDGLPVAVDEGRLFRVDLRKPARPRLGPGPLAEMARAIALLHRLARPARADDPLVQFRDAFRERYGDREVPLTEVLDQEVGIGFGDNAGNERAPLLHGLNFPAPAAEGRRSTARDERLLSMLASALGEGRTEIRLEAADLDALASSDPPPLPDCLEVIAMLAASSPEAVDRGDFRLLVRGIPGPPGVGIVGRFCHGDADLARLVGEHLRAEEACRPDAVFAEVVHLPQGRLGNILCRPVLRRFEIPYLGRSGAPADATIALSDLTVSVIDGRIRLWSQRLDLEVIPRLTTAHDFTTGSLAVYHFLCALQDQGTAARLGWDWGPLIGAPYLPRVTSGRLVLARAQWNLTAAEMSDIGGLRAAGRLPRFVAVADGDNDLVTDLENPLSLESLRRHTAGRESVGLMELFPGPEDLCAVGPNGHFTHDLVVPFVRGPARSAPSARRRPGATLRRRFPPGSEWFYAKLYTGPATADRVLVDLVRPMVDHAMEGGLADSWHFIRYSDPEWHVRLRIHGDAAALLPLLDEAVVPLLADGRIWRVQLDTYERELERYGGNDGMILSEDVFHRDSEAVLALVEGSRGDAGQEVRWRLAVLGIDTLLTDLGFDLTEKVAWAEQRRGAYADEFRVDGRLKGQLGERYRTHRRELGQLLERADDPSLPTDSTRDVLRRRSEHLRPIGHAIRGHGLDVWDLAASYAHMHVIRLLRSAHRAQEVVLYDLLHRLYVARRETSETPSSR